MHHELTIAKRLIKTFYDDPIDLLLPPWTHVKESLQLRRPICHWKQISSILIKKWKMTGIINPYLENKRSLTLSSSHHQFLVLLYWLQIVPVCPCLISDIIKSSIFFFFFKSTLAFTFRSTRKGTFHVLELWSTKLINQEWNVQNK